MKRNRIRKLLTRITIILLALAIILAGVGVWFVRNPWPQVNGTISVSGLQSPVEVIRDQWGVPNIYAENEHDLFFAQGYVHAQDRLWQMEVNRRLSSGTLSEVVGPPLIGLSIFMRTLGLRRAAEQTWTTIDSDSRAILEAYAEGVNAYIQSHRNQLPIEFTIFSHDPEPWTPIDTLTWGNMMAYQMSANHRLEIVRSRVAARLGEEAMQQLFPPFDKNTPSILTATLNSFNLPTHLVFAFDDADKWLGNPSVTWGSNNWVVAGNRTTTGMPILANDTHTDLQMPSPWYENGLHGGRYDSVGFTFPGTPLIIVGHNQHLAWGITNMAPDVQDFYLEKLNAAEDPTQYEFMGKWYDLEVIQEPVKVRGMEDPIPWRVYLTQHGPILNGTFPDVPSDAPPIALRWTLYEGNNIFRSIMRLNLATNWNEFRESLRQWDAPGQNFVYADMKGNIGYQATGKIPIRPKEDRGLEPVAGWTGEHEWQSYIPFEELPSAFNPSEGFVATANNRVVSDDYPYLLSASWDAGYRAKQISQVLTADKTVSITDTRNLQADTYSPPAEAIRPYLVAVEPEDVLQTEALARVKAWDLRYSVDSVGASIYEMWYLSLLRDTLWDEFGEKDPDPVWGLTSQYQFYADYHMPMMIDLLDKPQHPWWDDVNTPQTETRDDIIRRSLADTVSWLVEQYGENPDGWQWGKLHTVTFVHVPLGESGIGLVERLFNSRTSPVAGGNASVNAATSNFSINSSLTSQNQSFPVVFGASIRMIVDVGNWDRTLSINSTGQSGQLFHPNREDQSAMWQNVEYRPMFFTREAVGENAQNVLRLTPN